jgi:hypothetical protein
VGIGDRAWTQALAGQPVDPLLNLVSPKFTDLPLADVGQYQAIAKDLVGLSRVRLPVPGWPRHVFRDELLNGEPRLWLIASRVAINPDLSQVLHRREFGSERFGPSH